MRSPGAARRWSPGCGHFIRACASSRASSASPCTTTSQPRRHVTRSDAGNEAWREFCGSCGSPLFAGNSGNPSFIALKVASLDDPRPAAPQVQVWTGSAPPWAHIHPELPSFVQSTKR